MGEPYAFFEGNVVPLSAAKVGIMTHALNYGTGCFEGIRGYWVPEDEQVYLFARVSTLNACTAPHTFYA